MASDPTQPVTLPDTDSIIWKAYGNIIKRLIAPGGSIGEDTFVYVCPPTQAGIAAGPWIFPAVTNNQIYHVADSLLTTDTPLFLPGGGSYFDALRTYMSYVQLTANLDAGAQIRLTEALTALDAAVKHYQDLKKAAEADFAADPEKGNTPFSMWCIENAPNVIDAQRAMQGASATYTQATIDVSGPNAPEWSERYNALTAAVLPSPQPGLNMLCLDADLNEIQANFKAAQGGAAPVDPTSTSGFTRPSYTIQGYSEAVNNWVKTFNTSTPQEFKLDISSAKNTNWSDFGFEHTVTTVGASIWFFFSASFTQDETTVTQNLHFTDVSSDVEVTLTIQGHKVFSPAPGTWDIPGIKKEWQKLRSDAPDSLSSSLVKVTSLLVAYGVGMTVKFSGQAKDQIDNMYSNAKNTSGGVSIFGWTIGGSSSQSTRKTTFDSKDYTYENGAFTIPPQDDAYPVLLGVLGQRLPRA